jgi:hypothetical protein
VRFGNSARLNFSLVKEMRRYSSRRSALFVESEVASPALLSSINSGQNARSYAFKLNRMTVRSVTMMCFVFPDSFGKQDFSYDFRQSTNRFRCGTAIVA